MKKNIETGVYATLIIGIILSSSIYYFVSIWEESKKESFFIFNAKIRLHSFEAAIERHLDVVNLMEALFSSSKYVSRTEFRGFVERVLERDPTIQGLSWNPLIKDDEREKYTEEAHKDGFKNFDFTELDSEGKMVVSTIKKEYIPVYYIEPYERNKVAMGFDIASQITRKKTIEMARDTGKLVISERLSLVQKGEISFGALFMKAVYENNKVVDTQEKRRKYFKGVVVGVFHFTALAKTAMKGLEPIGMNLVLSDLSAEPEKQELYVQSSIRGETENSKSAFNKDELQNNLFWKNSIDILGHEWSFLFTAAPKFLQDNKSWNALIFLITGLFITFLLVLYMLTKAKNAADLEQKVLERTQELEVASRAKSDFLANMSHEIRTPLNGMIGFIELLYKDEKSLERREKFKIVKESGELLLSVINDILDFSKLQNSKLLIEKEPVNLPELFTQTVKLYFAMANEKDVLIILTIDEDFPQRVLGDSTRIKQVFLNLLSNAIKFSNSNSKVIVNIHYLSQTRQLLCEVIDQGIGIEAKLQKSIFHSFEQADSSTTRKYGGTGLGLSISKALIELMDGEIGLESELHGGSRFYFTLPVPDAPALSQKAEIKKKEKKKLHGRVLIVEDNKTNQILLKVLLKDLNLESEVVNDGSEAVEAVKNKVYDLILMDENMPILNGTQATRIIRTLNLGQSIPIIAVTANALKGDEEKFLECGMNAYLSKPIDAKKLEDILRKYL